jgi:hypothetical protein
MMLLCPIIHHWWMHNVILIHDNIVKVQHMAFPLVYVC